MSSEPRDDQVWYRLGYALERVRQATDTGGTPTQKGIARIPSTPTSKRGSLNPFLEVGAGWLERQLAVRVQGWVGRRARTPWIGAIAGAAVELAGATATGLMRAENKARQEESDHDESDHDTGLPPRPASIVVDPLGTAARGAAHGLIYGGLVSGIPLPAWSKGVAYGLARYLTSQGGGLAHLLGPISPHRAVPLLHTMVAEEDAREPVYIHIATGVALALIYESSPASRGTMPERDGAETD